MTGTTSRCGTTPKRTLMAVLVYALGFSTLAYILGALLFPVLPFLASPYHEPHALPEHSCAFVGCQPFGLEDLPSMLKLELGKAVLVLAPFSFLLGRKMSKKQGAIWFVAIAGVFAALFSEFAIPQLESLRNGSGLWNLNAVFSAAFALIAGTLSVFAYWSIAMKGPEPNA